MLKRLLLLIGLFCFVALYGQNDYVIKKTGNGLWSAYYIESKNAREQRVAFMQNKLPYETFVPSNAYWQEVALNIRQTYIPSKALQKMVETKTEIAINFLFDCRGDMVDVVLRAGPQIFQILTKEQLLNIYHYFWTIKVPVNDCFGEKQYYRGQVFLLPRIEKKMDWEEMKKRRARLKKSKEVNK